MFAGVVHTWVDDVWTAEAARFCVLAKVGVIMQHTWAPGAGLSSDIRLSSAQNFTNIRYPSFPDMKVMRGDEAHGRYGAPNP